MGNKSQIKEFPVKIPEKRVEGEGDLAGFGDDIEISGTIFDEYDSDKRQFNLNGFIVQVTDKTDFDEGLTERCLKKRLQVEVEGEYRDGVNVADEIEPRESDVKVMLDSYTMIEDDDYDISLGGRHNWRSDDLANEVFSDRIVIMGVEVEVTYKRTAGGEYVIMELDD